MSTETPEKFISAGDNRRWQMEIWPGAEHYRRRHEYCGEYVSIMRELWQTGRSSFHGDFFQMDDCRCLPMPATEIPIICAAQSDAGTRFCSPTRRLQFLHRGWRQTIPARTPMRRRTGAAPSAWTNCDQSGRVCRLLRIGCAHAGRAGHRAGRARRHADFRRFRHRHGAVRHPRPAADAVSNHCEPGGLIPAQERRAIKSTSTMPSRARCVTPTVVRAGSRSGAKYSL